MQASQALWIIWATIPVSAATVFEAPESPKVTVRVYDLAGMSRSDVAEALRETAHIFRAAGVDLAWMAGDPGAPEAHLLDESISTMPTAAPHLVVARIVPKAGPGVPIEVLGKALPFANSGAQITIFLDHIKIHQGEDWVAVPILLGYALAHELGHVWLRSENGAHTSVGLMRPEWGPAEFQRMVHGALKFSPAQAAALRATLAAGPSSLTVTAHPAAPAPHEAAAGCDTGRRGGCERDVLCE